MTSTETEIVQLYRTDYVVILRMDNSFLKFSNGEIIIYGDWEEAQYDARTMNGHVCSCKSLVQNKQEELLTNIIKHLK